MNVFHASCDGREFSLISSSLIENGRKRGYIGFIYQTMVGRAPKAICLTISIVEGAVQASRSCDPIAYNSCEHSEICLENSDLISKVSFRLSDPDRFHEYFGVCPNDCSQFPVAELVRLRYSNQENQDQSWAIWVTFDKERGIFSPVLKKRKKSFSAKAVGDPPIRGFPANMKWLANYSMSKCRPVGKCAAESVDNN